MKTSIGASLPKDLYLEFQARSQGFPGGKSALIRESLRTFFSASPMSEEQKKILSGLTVDEAEGTSPGQAAEPKGARILADDTNEQPKQ